MNGLHYFEKKGQKFEEESTNNNMPQKLIRNFSNASKSTNNKNLKEKIKNYENKQILSKERKISFETISTVNSKLFNDKRDYEHYKKFYRKEDDFFIEEIVTQLRSKKNSVHN